MRESKIEGYLRKEIAKLGGWMEKHVSPGTKGPPDNIVMWPRWNENAIIGWEPTTLQREDGTPVGGYIRFGQPSTEFIETKAPDGDVSVLQARDHKRRRAMGFEVHVIWNMEQADSYLRSRGKR